MKRIIVVLLALFCYGESQSQDTDSVDYYKGKLWWIKKKLKDSLYRDPQYREAVDNLNRAHKQRDAYHAVSLYYGMISANYGRLNADNALSGFGSIHGLQHAIGFAYSTRHKRRMFSFNLVSIPFGRKTKKGEESIRATFAEALQFEWGYDLVRSQKVNLYPYAGFGQRIARIWYSAPVQGNPGFTNITNVAANLPEVTAKNFQWGYQAGLCLEVVSEEGEFGGGTLLFLKAGTNRALKDKGYHVQGYRYDPGIVYGNWTVSAGFRFFWK